MTNDKPQVDERYGRVAEGVHFAGYTLERALQGLEWLLEDDRWRSVGEGFEDIDTFLDSIKLGKDFRVVAEQRKRIATRIKGLHPEVSNRQIARTLRVHHRTVDRDLGAKAPSCSEKVTNFKEPVSGSGANAPPAVTSGAVATKPPVEPCKKVEPERAEKDPAYEARMLQSASTTRFRTIVIDPVWDCERLPTLEELLALDVRSWADEQAGCHLYCWVPNEFMARACDLIRDWGFQHRTIITWIKPPLAVVGSDFGNSTEHALFATLGDTSTREAAKSLPTHFEAKGGERSEKPQQFYEIVRAASYPPYAEASQRHPPPAFVNLFEVADPQAIPPWLRRRALDRCPTTVSGFQ